MPASCGDAAMTNHPQTSVPQLDELSSLAHLDLYCYEFWMLPRAVWMCDPVECDGRKT